MTEKLVPFMALIYIVFLAVGVILFNIGHVPAVFASIIEGAFHPAAVTGGAVGSFFMSMKKGVSRGIFFQRGRTWHGINCTCLCRHEKTGQAGIFWNFRGVCRHDCDLYAYRAGYFVQPGSGQLRTGGRGAELTISGFTATYGNWVSIFYCGCDVLFCIFHHYRMGIIRDALHRVFCSAPVSISRSCWCMHWLPLWVRPWIWV